MNTTHGKVQASPSKSSPTATRKMPIGGLLPSEGKKTNKPSAGKRQGHSPPRKAVSGSKSSASKNQSGKSSDAREEGDKDDMQTEAIPQLTKSGLKIIDWSGQGMTGIPFHLITAKDVGHLILSSNNLRSVPTEIAHLKYLEKLDVSKNSIRCTSSSDFSGLPQEITLLTKLTELCISECNLPFVPPSIFKMTSLKNLDIGRNKINILPPEIGQLVNLVRLNLQQTNITSLPPEIAYCQELEEVYLWGNSIENLPETLSEMPRLRVLALNYKSLCGVVDPYMENLLKKGQIKSEHIPMVVYELAALEVLDLENTKLNNIPDIYNKMLRELYLCKNFLQTIPRSIYSLRHLRILDMSNNLLSNLPEDIGQLKGLKILRLAVNNFEVIPSAIGDLTQLEEFNIAHNMISSLPPEIKGLTSLKVLILAKNKIQKLPDEICQLTQLNTLDLTDNEIHSLPTAMYQLTNLITAHTFHKLQKSGLWLYKNPLQQPPPEIWRSDKPDKTFEYLKNLVTFKIENLQRQKIMLFGNSQCGKTSLVRALTLRKSLLTYGPQDKTRLLQQTLWKTDNKVDFVLYDFGGDNAYRMLYRMFLDKKALVMIVYNAATLCNENFYSSIGQWLDMLSASSPGAVVKIVGTQTDLLHTNMSKDVKKEFIAKDPEPGLTQNSKSTIGKDDDDSGMDSLATIANTSSLVMSEALSKENTQDLVYKHLNSLETKIRDELQSLQSDIKQVEQSGQVADVDGAALKMMKVREKQLKNILKDPLKIVPDVSFVSASNNLEGILQLTGQLEHLAIDKELFPHAQQYIPDHWKQLLQLLKQKVGYYLYWDDIENMAELFSVKGEELQDCVKYFTDTADVLWFGGDPGLSQIVFHKPKVLVSIITSLYRHDIADFLTYENKVFFCKGRLSRQQFEQCADNFIHTGEISRPLLSCFLFPFNFKNEDITQLLELLPLLDICYSVPEPDVHSGFLHSYPVMVLPWYNKDTDTTFLTELWPVTKLHHDKELAVIYIFPFFCPPEVIPSLSALIQDLVDERCDWKDNIYASCGTKKLLLHHSVEEGKTLLTVLVRGSEFSEVQTLVEEIMTLVNNHLLRYPGLYWKLTVPMGVKNLKNVISSAD